MTWFTQPPVFLEGPRGGPTRRGAAGRAREIAGRAVAAPLLASRPALAAVAGFSTWVMVIFKPDGSHGMYSWLHVALATACALGAWYYLSRSDEELAGLRASVLGGTRRRSPAPGA